MPTGRQDKAPIVNQSMLPTDIFRLATRMFRTNRSRTVLTILGISVGIGTILFLVSFGYGLQQMILSQITNSDALLSLDVTTANLEGLKIDNDSIEKIMAVPGIDEVLPVASAQSQVAIDGITSDIQANFTDPDFFKLDGTIFSEGTFFQSGDKESLVISSAALKLFNMEEGSYLGRLVSLSIYVPDVQAQDNAVALKKLENNFRIVGVVDDENASYVYLPLSIAKESNLNDYSKIKVKVFADKDLEPARQSIIDNGFAVSALSDVIEQANQIFKVVQIVLALFGIIALIVSAIGMFNTMTIALLERTQEIGVMKALGATSLDVWNMFLAESVIIGFFGGLGGLLIGMLGGEAFNYGINILAKTMGGRAVDLFYTPTWFLILIISFSTIVGLITGFYPAKRAAAINCLEALRYK